ncbi:MAG TPA: hypothetical protein VKD08_01440, partial [Ignavibacteriaceae bacterium]|nr:hypothetical protein [Ignavibacteriaceae bacterium]
MIYTKFYKTFLLSLFFFISTASAQRATLDWKLHDVGEVRQLVTNTGALWTGVTDYPGLIYCEFPRQSHEEHVGEGGIWVGAILGNDTLVSVASGWNSSFEFYPTDQPWDTIWVVHKSDTANIPYWNNYIGVSDEDLVCRYSDYNVRTIAEHTPLYLDVIQNS